MLCQRSAFSPGKVEHRSIGWRVLTMVALLAFASEDVEATDPGEAVRDGMFLLCQPTTSLTRVEEGQPLGGWTVSSGNVDVAVEYFVVPDSASAAIDLNGSTAGCIRQVLQTVPGEKYKLSFLVSGHWRKSKGPKSLTVRIEGLRESLTLEKPAAWSRENMVWQTATYEFEAKSKTAELVFESTCKGSEGPVIAEVSAKAPVKPPTSLDRIPVPLPPDLDKYVADRNAAILLGKALFWDMQTGSDGKTACASCHWHAGADVRTRNTLNPGAPGSAFGHQTEEGPALAAMALAAFRGPNVDLKSEDFPFHRLENMDLPASDDNRVTFDTKEVVGSQGVVSKRFIEIVEGNPEDRGETTVHPVFNIDGVNVRQVTGRNSPTNINAVFFDRSFWDGRANRYFNGVNPFGNLDPDARVLKAVKKKVTDQGGKKKKSTTVTVLEPVRVLIDNAALASQAVGPPNNSVEMSWDGRTFRELARKMFSLRPLAQQCVDRDDSVLGDYRDESGRGLDNQKAGYAQLIRKAFRDEWWSGTTPTEDGYTHMEANFSLFWGLSIMLYESTLVSDETPFDHYRRGDNKALSAAAKRGLEIFLNEGKCINCHGGPEFAGATVSQLRGVLSDDGPIEFMAMARGSAFYDGGFYNIGVRQTEEDLGVGAAHPVFGPLSYSRQRQNGRDVGSDVDVPQDARVAVNGAFKTPTLRNIELTGPYFHNGGQKDLLGVVEFYVRGADFRKTNIQDLDPDVGGIPELQGNEDDQKALVEFMKHLTDERVRYQKAPFDHPELIITNGHTGIEGGVALDNDFVLPAVGKKGGQPFGSFDQILKKNSP